MFFDDFFGVIQIPASTSKILTNLTWISWILVFFGGWKSHHYSKFSEKSNFQFGLILLILNVFEWFFRWLSDPGKYFHVLKKSYVDFLVFGLFERFVPTVGNITPWHDDDWVMTCWFYVFEFNLSKRHKKKKST